MVDNNTVDISINTTPSIAALEERVFNAVLSRASLLLGNSVKCSYCESDLPELDLLVKTR